MFAAPTVYQTSFTTVKGLDFSRPLGKTYVSFVPGLVRFDPTLGGLVDKIDSNIQMSIPV